MKNRSTYISGEIYKAIGKVVHIALFFIFLFHISCDKDEATRPPQITFVEGEGISGDTLAGPGDNLDFALSARATGEDITLFYIKVTTDSSRLYFDTGFHSHELVWRGSFIKGTAEKEEWAFFARDRDGNEASVAVNIILDTTGSYGTLISREGVRLGAQDNNLNRGFLEIATGNTWSYNEASADEAVQDLIDVIYYYGEDQNTIASPGANVEQGVFPSGFDDWAVINTSRFHPATIGESDFYGMTNDSLLIADYDESNAKRKAKNLQPGDIYFFRTQKGKLGSFLVKNVSGTNEGYVEIDIKIQE